MNGTTTSASSCEPLIVTLPRCHSLVIGLGNAVCKRPLRYPGRVSVTARASSATPMVATRTITRGALNNRRITASSTTVPASVPLNTAKRSEGQYGQCDFPAMTASKAAAGTPRSPTAKLITRLDR